MLQNANNATMLKLYLSCIRPELEYAATVWSHLKGQIDTLESVRKLAMCQLPYLPLHEQCSKSVQKKAIFISVFYLTLLKE